MTVEQSNYLTRLRGMRTQLLQQKEAAVAAEQEQPGTNQSEMNDSIAMVEKEIERMEREIARTEAAAAGEPS